MLFRSPFLGALFILPVTIYSYGIDESCVKKGIDGDVRNAMASAFGMVDSALGRLNQNPYDADTVDLIRRLFMPKNGQNPNNRGAMDKVRLVLRNINANYRSETTGPLQPTDIMIYCDDSRYVYQGKRDKLLRKIYYDTTTNTYLLYKDQSCHDGLGDITTLAVTTNFKTRTEEWDEARNELDVTYTVGPAQLQLCPWFIDWIKSKEYKLGNQVARSNIGRFVVKKAENNQGFTQIDAFGLLDKVLLHEMTHGRSAFFNQKKINNKWKDVVGITDVDVPRSWLIPFFQRRPAYGWKWARELALLGPDVNGVVQYDVKAPDHNADSLALFASAAKLLDDQLPRRVLDDGFGFPPSLGEKTSEGVHSVYLGVGVMIFKFPEARSY